LHEGLRCADIASDLSDAVDPYSNGLWRATAAALAGRRTSMRGHLASAAATISDDWGPVAGYLARDLAINWRRTLTIAMRVGAKDDAAAGAPCAITAAP
jgi:hypothetical protein